MSPLPLCAGYSQSMSIPSTPNCVYSFAMLPTNVWRFCAVETAEEKYLVTQASHISATENNEKRMEQN